MSHSQNMLDNDQSSTDRLGGRRERKESMSNEHITKAIDDFNRYFTSLNGVDVDARVSVPRDEWRALFALLRPAAHDIATYRVVGGPEGAMAYAESKSE